MEGLKFRKHLRELVQTNKQQLELIASLKKEIESKDLCISQLQILIEEKIKCENSKNSRMSKLEERSAAAETDQNRLRQKVACLTSENSKLRSQIRKGQGDDHCAKEIQDFDKFESNFIQELTKLREVALDPENPKFALLKGEVERNEEGDEGDKDNLGVLIGLREIHQEFKICFEERMESIISQTMDNDEIFKTNLATAEEKLWDQVAAAEADLDAKLTRSIEQLSRTSNSCNFEPTSSSKSKSSEDKWTETEPTPNPWKYRRIVSNKGKQFIYTRNHCVTSEEFAAEHEYRAF